MVVFSFCLAFLLFSPVLAKLNEAKNENKLDASTPNGTPLVYENDTAKHFFANNRVEPYEMIVKQNLTSVVATTPDLKTRAPNKRRKNRVNRLNRKGSRPNGRNRRPLNEKNRYKKKVKQPNNNAIRYLDRSPLTDQLNKAVDDMLACMSQTISNQNTTFSFRLNAFRANTKISPWAFVALNETDTSKMTEIVIQRKNRRTRATNNFKSDTVEIDAIESYVEDDVAKNLAEETTLDSVTETSDDGDESSTVPEDLTSIGEDDVDDSTESVTYSFDNFTQVKQDNSTEDHRTEEPSPVVLSDGRVEYSLQLLGENETDKTENREVEFYEEELPEQQDEAGRQAKKLDNKRDQNVSRSYSRRPSAKVEGMGLIQRNGDVLVGMRQNSSVHIIETQLLIGPLHCVMDKKAGLLLQKSRVSMPQLTAKLRLTEVGGKLTEVQLRPTKIRPNEALVTLRLSENGNLPSNFETARLVSYLSREMTRAWNSGYLLRRIKRQFKQLFVVGTASKEKDSKHEDARKLVEMLTFSAFEGPQSVDTGKNNKEFSKS